MDCFVVFVVNWCFFMVGMFVVVLIGGFIVFNQFNIEVYFDLILLMVDIVMQSLGLLVEEIECYIMILIEIQVVGLKNIMIICIILFYGLFDVKIQFFFVYIYDEVL